METNYDGDYGETTPASETQQAADAGQTPYDSSAPYSDGGSETREDMPRNNPTPDKNNTRQRVAKRNTGREQANDVQTSNRENDYLESLPPYIKEVFNKYDNDPVKIAEAYKAISSTLGKRYESFSDSDWKLFFEANEKFNDVPASKEGYQFQFEPDEEGHQDMLGELWQNGMAELAHEIGLTRNQANTIYNFINFLENEHIKTDMNTRNQYIEKNMKDIQKAWGKTYDLQMARANKGIDVWAEIIGSSREELLEEITNVGAQHNAKFLQLMAILGGEGSETPNTKSFNNNMTPRSASIRLEEMRNDPQKMSILAKPWHPLYKQVSEEVNSLARKKNNY